MDEYIKKLEKRIEELKSWKNSLQREAHKQVWVRRIGYFAAGWGAFKLVRRKSTFTSNVLMGAGFITGLKAGSNIDALNYDTVTTTKMIEDKEEELKDVKKLEEERKKEQEKQLVLEPVKDNK